MNAVRTQPWGLVLGSAFALIVGNGPIMQFTFGIFLKPIIAEFHVERGVASLALMAGLTATALALPTVGALVDRWGPRKVGLAGVAGLAVMLVITALAAHSIWTFGALFAVAGVAAAAQTPLPYAKAITACFEKRRGLALAIMMCGVGVGSIIMPIIAQKLTAAFGWRGGYLGIAALLVVIATPILLFVIPNKVVLVTETRIEEDLPGLTVSEAFKQPAFWLIVGALFLAAGAANGTIAHVAPMLTDRGVSPAQAAAAIGLVGASAIVGRLVGGQLLDRVWAPLVSMIFFAGLIGGILLMAFVPTPQAATIAVVLIGLGLGVEADLVGFLASRYFGLKAFGALFGILFGAFILASSLGPILMGFMFDLTGSYVTCLLIFAAGLVVAAGALLSLGAYAYPSSGAPTQAPGH